MANSQYKDQFKKATKGLTSGGKDVTLDKRDAQQLENEMIELYPKAAELEQLCLLLDRDYIDTSVVRRHGDTGNTCPLTTITTTHV